MTLTVLRCLYGARFSPDIPVQGRLAGFDGSKKSSSDCQNSTAAIAML